MDRLARRLALIAFRILQVLTFLVWGLKHGLVKLGLVAFEGHLCLLELVVFETFAGSNDLAP